MQNKEILTARLNSFKFYLTVEKGLADNTIESYLTDVIQFFEETGKDISHTDSADIINFFVSLQEIGISFKTIARKRSSLKVFFGFLTEEGIENSVNFDDIPGVKTPSLLPDVIDVDEMLHFLDSLPLETALDYRNKAMFELMYATGLRISEMLNLRLSDLMESEKLVRVFGKGRKERYIPVADESLEWIFQYIRSYRRLLKKQERTDIVFLNRSGNKLSRMGVWKIIQKKMFETGITKHVSPHTFRHSFATHLLQSGTNLRIVQALLGHSSINTTQIYTNIDIKYLREEHRKHHPRNHLE